MAEWVISFIKEKLKLSSRRTTKLIGSSSFLVLALALVINLQPADLHDDYFAKTSDAGKLVNNTELSASQKKSWHLPQVPWPTWVSNRWDLSTMSIASAKDLATVPPNDIVLLRIDRIPDWLDSEIEFALENREGNYATIRASAMQKYVDGVYK